MRKSLPIIVLFLIGIVVNLSALEPIRVSVVTTPFTSKTVFIDILLSDGTSSGISKITKPALSTDGAGVLSFVLNELAWTALDIATVRNYIVQISYATGEGSSTIISLQRLEDVIANQGLLGALVDPDEINQVATYDFLDIRALEMVLKDDGIEGAEEGNILNTITFDAPIDVTESYTLLFPPAPPITDGSFLKWVEDQTSAGAHLEWSTFAENINPDAGLAIVPEFQQSPEALDDGVINLMADIDEETLKFSSYSEQEINGTTYNLPDPDAKMLVDENNPFNWNAMHVFGYGLRDSIINGGPHWAIGYQDDMESWFNGVQSFIYEAQEEEPFLRETFYAGAVTSGNRDAGLIVRHIFRGEGTTTDEIGMRLPQEGLGYVQEPVLYIRYDSDYTFGVDLYGHMLITGSIENDGVNSESNSNPNTVIIDDELVVNGSLQINADSDGDPLTFPINDGDVGQILTTNGAGVMNWADFPTVTLQSAYNGGREINATAGPVRILNANTVNGGLDVYASGLAGDAIDARLDGTLGTTQTAVQGVYTVEIPSEDEESTITLTHTGYLGGSINMGEELIIAGIAGTSFNEFGGGSVGALGVTIPGFEGDGAQYAAFLIGDVYLEGSFVEPAYFNLDVFVDETLDVSGYTHLRDKSFFYKRATFNAGVLADSFSMPLTRGTPGQVLTTNGAGATSWGAAGSGWGLSGNTGTTPGTNFIGTSDAQPLVFKIHNTEAGRIAYTSGNTSLGYSALISTTNIANTAMGFESMKANTSGSYNTAYGAGSLTANIVGEQNTALGYNALAGNKSGGNNAALGLGALYSNVSGFANTGIGTNALFNITAGYNTGLGFEAGRYITGGSTANTTSTASLYLGAGTKASANGNTNEIVIGNDAVGSGSNSITLGNTAIEKTVTRGSVILSNDAGTITSSNTITVPPNLSVYYIASNSDGTDDTVTLPTGINGQMLYVIVYDPDGHSETGDDLIIDFDGTTEYIQFSRFDDYIGITLIYSNGGWQIFGVHEYSHRP